MLNHVFPFPRQITETLTYLSQMKSENINCLERGDDLNVI